MMGYWLTMALVLCAIGAVVAAVAIDPDDETRPSPEEQAASPIVLGAPDVVDGSGQGPPSDGSLSRPPRMSTTEQTTSIQTRLGRQA